MDQIPPVNQPALVLLLLKIHKAFYQLNLCVGEIESHVNEFLTSVSQRS